MYIIHISAAKLQKKIDKYKYLNQIVVQNSISQNEHSNLELSDFLYSTSQQSNLKLLQLTARLCGAGGKIR